MWMHWNSWKSCKHHGRPYRGARHCVKSVRIWNISGPYSDWIRRDASYLSVFSPNAGNAEQKNSEYGQKLAKNSENWLQRIWWIHFGFQIELQYLNERIIRISVSTSYSSDLFRGIIEFYIELYTFLQ